MNCDRALFSGILFKFINMTGLRFLIGLFVCMSTCSAYKVLVVFPYPDKSHGILGSALVKHLINYGYEVTYITPFAVKHPHPNLQEVDVSMNLNFMRKESVNITSLMSQEFESNTHESILYHSRLISTRTLEHENVQKLMNNINKQFDLIIIEWLYSELLTGLSAVFEAPYILVANVEPHWIVTRLIDDALNPSYNSDPFSIYLPPFTFKQRVEQLWTQVKVSFFKLMIDDIERVEYERLIEPIIKKRGRVPPSFYDVKYNASLVLGNTHVSFGQATTLPQRFKSIGGYHVDEEVLPLPPNIQYIMDKAKHGVIYFNLGPDVNSTDIPDDVKRKLLHVFGTLNQTVIWKLEDNPTELPRNVNILKWAPQQSVLAHQNCVLFITNGDQLSTIEAVHFGVPIIGIPTSGDQLVNIERAVNKGFALRVKLSPSMADHLKLAIQEVLTDKKYSETAKILSAIYHHRPVRPGAELAHWAEHVVLTKGAPHLRSYGALVPLYQKLYLDLVMVTVGVILMVIKVFKRFFRPFPSKVVSVKKRN